MTNLDKLEKQIGVKFKNRDLLSEALTHRSFLNENNQKDGISNERLEFLGDSVLSFVVAQELFIKNQKANEGDLTALRSLLVRSQTLAECAQEISLGEYLFLSHGEKRNGQTNPTLLADAYEALLGAIYLDQGMEKASDFVHNSVLKRKDAFENDINEADLKGKLQMIVQEKYKKTPIYKLLSEEGPDHKKNFTVGVYLVKKLLGKGSGESLKKASQDAASSALESFKEKN